MENEIYQILKKHKLPLKKREEVLTDLLLLFSVSQTAVISSFSSTVEKQQSFYNELKALLVKYDAELTIDDFGGNWQSDEKIVVDFKYDESFFEKENTGIIPQLVLGRYENGS